MGSGPFHAVPSEQPFIPIMAKSPNLVQSLGKNLLKGLQELSGGGTETVWNVCDRYIAGDRAVAVNRIREILLASGRLFLYDNDVVFERRLQEGRSLLSLMVEDRLELSAPAHLANLLHVAMPGKDDAITYQLPSKVVSEVLNSEVTRDLLPRLSFYSRRPLFNKEFELRVPGYHASDGLLVHGESIDPVLWPPPQAERAVDRLPPGLRKVLGDFCFRTDADLVDALAMLLTGVLVNHFIDDGKPVFLVNGNQPNIGKTLLATVASLIFDNEVADSVKHTDDQDELSKRLGARFNTSKPFSLLLFDNRKGTIGGELLESMALAPRVSVRLLKHSKDIERSNNFLWVFTANGARATPDMTSRAVIIELRYDGNPKDYFVHRKTNEAELKAYTRKHRQQILGELFGMVIRWREAGSPLKNPLHRLQRWSAMIGGMLDIAGLPEFLANIDETALEVDGDLQDLIALAEHVMKMGRQDLYSTGKASATSPGKTAKDWLSVFRDAQIGRKELAECTHEKAQTSFVGKFFGSRLNRSIPILSCERSGKATLRCEPMRMRQKRYWFEVVWDDDAPNIPEPLPSASAGCGVSLAATPLPAVDMVEQKTSATNLSSRSIVGSDPQTTSTGNSLDW